MLFGVSIRRHFQISSIFADINNPFRVLGIPVNSDYDTAKRAFLEAVKKHHPDLEGGSTEAFVRIRNALETIQKSTANAPNVEDDETLRRWFKPEVGKFLLFEMSEKTRKEVIHCYKTMSQGGKDKGGYWEMARQLAERDSLGWDKDKPIQLISGGSSSVTGRRRRKTS